MNYKKLITLCTIFLILLSLNLSAKSSNTYSDLPEDHWAFKSINEMTKLGILEGYSNGMFKPNDPITREQFAKILVLSQDMTLTNPIKPTFKDVTKDDWAYKYIETAKEYFSGYTVAGNKYFNGTDLAIRENVAVAMVKSNNLETDDIDLSILDEYQDKNDINSDIINYISIAVKNKIMEGYGNNIFGPKNYLTRAEACELIYKVNKIYGTKFKYFDTEPINNGTAIDPRDPITFTFLKDIIVNKNTNIDFMDSNTSIAFDIEYNDEYLKIIPKESLKFDTKYIIKIPQNTFIINGDSLEETIILEFTTAESLFEVVNDTYSINKLNTFNDGIISFKYPEEFEFANEVPKLIEENNKFLPKSSNYNSMRIVVQHTLNHSALLDIEELSLDNLYTLLYNNFPEDEIIKTDNYILKKSLRDSQYDAIIYINAIENYNTSITISSYNYEKQEHLVNEISDIILNEFN